MAVAGVTRRWGGTGRSVRAAVALTFATALLAGGQGAAADPAVDPEPAPPPAEEPSEQPAEATSDEPADATSDEPADEPADSPPATGGFGGAASGPADLILLPEDPDYPVPAPPSNAELPLELDAVPGYLDNAACDPVQRPGVSAFANLISKHYDRTYYTTARANCSSNKSLHHEGRALDWSLDAGDPMDRRIGDDLVVWLTENDGEMAARFGISQIIWNQRVWNSWTPDQWYAYVGVSGHTDHIHFSFSWDGAQMRTSWWTGVPVTEPDLGPCAAVAGTPAAISEVPRTQECAVDSIAAPASDFATVYPLGVGPGVEVFQEEVNLPVTGELDEGTRAALLDWQEQNGVPRTGVLDQFSYAALTGAQDLIPDLEPQVLGSGLPDYAVTEFTAVKNVQLGLGDSGPAVELLQDALEVEADGVFGEATEAALLAYTTDHPWLAPATSTDPLLWHILEREQMVTLDVRHIGLEPGDDGPVVALLQDQLGIEADGQFGQGTEDAVREAQAENGLAVTGRVDGDTWAVVDTGQRSSRFVVDEWGRTWYRGSLLLDLDDLPVATR